MDAKAINRNQLRLVLNATYDLNGEPIEDMQENISNAIYHAIGNGMLTGSSSAEIAGYDFTVLTIPHIGGAGEIDNAIGAIVDMAESHVDDIDSGLQDGIYDAAENQDLDRKKDSIAMVSSVRERIVACLDVCEGIDSATLSAMGKGSMERQRDRAYLDRSLYLEMREMLVSLVSDAETGVNQMASKVHEAMKLIMATEPDGSIRPGGSLLAFTEGIANLKKWSDDQDEASEMPEPSDGAWDSHTCLMDSIDGARMALYGNTNPRPD